MINRERRLFRSIATKSIIAALPVVMVSAYASNLFVPTPPRLAAYDYRPVAEISVNSTTVGLADSNLYFLTDPTLTIDPVEVARHLDAMQALGVENIRVYVPWRFVEPTRGEYDWSSMDVIMGLAAQRNMGVLAEINTTPKWTDPNDQYQFGAAHPDVDEFTVFVSDVATRYGSTVSAYEIWNEPNYYGFYDPVDPAAYAELLKAVYPVLKAIDPTATVVAAGVGHAPTTVGDTVMSPVEFVQGMYDAGAKGYFDALAYHPYQGFIKFSEGDGPNSAIGQAQALAAIMASEGDYVLGPDGTPVLDGNGNPITKKIWATEYGVPTYTLSFDHQRDFIADFLQSWSTQSWAGPAYVYTTVDTNLSADPNENAYGIYAVDANGNWVAKPAAQVLADWIVAHPNQTFDPSGPTDPSDPAGPGNPLQALVLLVQHFVQQFISATSQAFGAIVAVITNWFGSLVGSAATTAAPLSLRVASVDAADSAGQTEGPSDDAGDVSAAMRNEPSSGSDAIQGGDANTLQAVVSTTAVSMTAVVTGSAVAEAGLTEPDGMKELGATPEIDETPAPEAVLTISEVKDPVVTAPEVADPPAAGPPAPAATSSRNGNGNISGSATSSAGDGASVSGVRDQGADKKAGVQGQGKITQGNAVSANDTKSTPADQAGTETKTGTARATSSAP